MAFTSTGRDLAPGRNEQTGKPTIVDDATGNPAFDNTKSYAVASAVVMHRGEWHADRSGDFGSRVHEVKMDKRGTPSQLESYALDGVQPLVDSGEIVNPSATVTGATGRRRLEVKYTTPKAGAQTVKVPL